ncbi:hypothetical protein [Candidatus Uabimicrobium amorphum]|uniref:Uncharacterized protein n=1 Tax=Uabimicrobium amorphum TaxID=2596890 RepID=A0A5S9INU5_UABAM|nr:hypothetical protein [Candidatus Uabimicrobium amorphum]BBM84470.1 hypothetical protein UABAM_02831 [Candidatus Uabimicrobium amorphum]
MDFIDNLKESGITQVSWGGSGFASSYLAHSKAKQIMNSLEENTWLGYVMPGATKKVVAVGAAVVATGATSIAASIISPENRKYVWIGGFLSLILILTQEVVGIGSGGSIGNSSEGVNNGSGEGQSTIPTEQEVIDAIHNLPNQQTMQELKKTGFIDAIIENNNTLIVTVGDDVIYSPIGSAYIVDSSTMEIFLNEALFLIANAQQVENVEIRRNFGNQDNINSTIDRILDQAQKYNKITILRDKPVISWGTVNAS